MSAPPSRKPRFKRVPVENIQLTERDLAIIRQVFKHRFLRSTHIVALLNSSPQMTVRRLQLLYHHGYLDRPWEQVEFYQKVGSRPMAYGLGNIEAPISWPRPLAYRAARSTERPRTSRWVKYF